jgi:hypothetical protein
MPAASRAAWTELFENTCLEKKVKPVKAWELRAKAALGKLPSGEFRRQVRKWFEPFRDAEPLHLTVCGRDVLRNLRWCARLEKDGEVDEAISWYASAQWRNKQDKSCSETLIPTFASVLMERSDELAYAALSRLPLQGKVLQDYQAFCARVGRVATAKEKEKTPAKTPDVLSTMIKRLAAPDRVQVEGDFLVINGSRDTYEIDIKEGRIARRSDGRPIRLEMDLSRPEAAMLRHMLDAGDIADPFRPNYFRLIICARVLLNDETNEEIIVVDE